MKHLKNQYYKTALLQQLSWRLVYHNWLPRRWNLLGMRQPCMRNSSERMTIRYNPHCCYQCQKRWVTWKHP